jgi:hypothetical protein
VLSRESAISLNAPAISRIASLSTSVCSRRVRSPSATSRIPRLNDSAVARSSAAVDSARSLAASASSRADSASARAASACSICSPRSSAIVSILR